MPAETFRRPSVVHHALTIAALGVGLGTVLIPARIAAQEVEPNPDLATLFELGALVQDTNGDSVPDFVNATLVLVVLLIVATGLYALSVLPRQEDPKIETRFAFILTQLPGARRSRNSPMIRAITAVL